MRTYPHQRHLVAEGQSVFGSRTSP